MNKVINRVMMAAVLIIGAWLTWGVIMDKPTPPVVVTAPKIVPTPGPTPAPICTPNPDFKWAQRTKYFRGGKYAKYQKEHHDYHPDVIAFLNSKAMAGYTYPHPPCHEEYHGVEIIMGEVTYYDWVPRDPEPVAWLVEGLYAGVETYCLTRTVTKKMSTTIVAPSEYLARYRAQIKIRDFDGFSFPTINIDELTFKEKK